MTGTTARELEHVRRATRTAGWTLASALLLSCGQWAGLGGALMPAGTLAQAPSQSNPVYVDDSPQANDTFVRLREHLASGNLEQGASVLQALLLNQADRVVASEGDADVFVSVRARAHAALLASPDLLARYRRAYEPRAERLAEEGGYDELERAYLLTGPGMDAALRLSQRRLETAAFEAARLTLAQLEKHPDRTGQRGARAAAIAGQIARYLPRADVAEWAARWAREAGADAPAGKPEAWPAGALSFGRTPLDPGPAPTPDGLVTKPLWTVTVNPAAAESAVPSAGRGAQNVPAQARDLLVLPAASGDTLVLNDGASVTAWDRFTLSPRWSVVAAAQEPARDEPGLRAGAGNRMILNRMYGGQARGGDDLGVAAIGGGIVVAPVGKPVALAVNAGYSREMLDRVLGLDLATGRTRWAVTLGEVDPALADCAVKGAPLVLEGTVVLAARKYQPDRRLVSVSMVGLDLYTGAKRWVRPVGSAGSMPWGNQPSGSDLLTADRGIVYRSDRLGVVGAVEAHSGRTVWIRRSPVEAGLPADTPPAWQAGQPIVDGGSVLALSGDGRRLLWLDALTGAKTGERGVSDFAPPGARYFLLAGDRLVGVGDDRIGSVALADAKAGKVEAGAAVPAPGIRGRVVVVGEGTATRLMVPTIEGVRLYDPAKPAKPERSFNLEETGQVLALESQLVVADDARLHSYLLWDVAERLLLQRVKDSPEDAAPAVTFAELAHRAGKPERIAEAVDLAMAALRRGPASDATASVRSRLLDVLRTILGQGLEAPVAKAGAGDAKPAASAMDPALLAKLVASFGELAGAGEERVGFLLASGKLKEIQGQPADAAAAYQQVLDDPALASATWRGAQLSVRAELEATRRLEALIRVSGASAYAAQEAKAQAEFEALGPQAGPEKLEALTQRFPLAQSVLPAYARLADAYGALDKPQAAIAALEAGLRAARRLPSAPTAAVGELGGRLIQALRARGQNAAAASTLRTMRQHFANLVLTSAGQPLDAGTLAAELDGVLAASARWPRVGPVSGRGGEGGAQVVLGSKLMEPILAEPMPSLSPLLVMRSETGVGVWAPTTAGKAGSGTAYTKAWSRDLQEGTEPTLVRLTRDGAVLMYMSAEPWIERLGPGPGADAANAAQAVATKWRSDSLARLFSREETRGMRRVPGVLAEDGFGVPGEGVQDSGGVLVSMDDRTIIVVQRTGRAAGIDLETGEILWVARTGAARVYDAQVLGGTLVVAGTSEVLGAGNQVVDLRPVVQIIDARTGRAVQKLEGAAPGQPSAGLIGGQPRWVRLTDTGAAIIGLDSAIASIDLATAQTNWTITEPKVVPALAAWLVGDQLVLLSTERLAFLAGATTGRLREAPLELPRTHVDSTRVVDVVALGASPSSNFAIAGNQGVAVFSPEGTLLGLDAFGGGTSMLPPRPAEGRIVAIETVSEGRTTDGMMMFNIHGLEPAQASLIDSRAVVMGARPTTLRLVDNHIALTAGNVTLILDAPAKKP